MASLIGFDKNRENLQFKGHSKLSINFVSNYLYVEPENEEFKMISASFKWNYAMKKNLLFVFADHDFMDFCLKFNNEQICRKIFNYITSPQKNDTENNIFKIDNSFVNPIFQTISDNPLLNSDLIKTIAEWHQLLDADEKEKYSTLMKAYCIYDIIAAAIQNQDNQKTESMTRKRKHSATKEEFKVANNAVIQHQSRNQIIRKPAYEIFENCIGTINKFLVIFSSEVRNHCYEYVLKNNKYLCRRCYNLPIATSKMPQAKIYNEGSAKEFVKIFNEHRCQKLEFEQKKYQQYFDYVLEPNFEIQKFIRNGKEGKRLIIFDPNDRSKCYRYFYCSIKEKYFCYGCKNKGKYVPANMHQNSEDEEYIILSNIRHVCEMQQCIPHKITLYPPEFEYLETSNKGNPKILLFVKNDRSKCYIFFKNCGMFICVGCKAFYSEMRRQKKQNTECKLVCGSLLKDDNGEYSFQMKSNQFHCCQPRQYQHELHFVSKTPDFFYYRLKKQPKTVKVAIYSSENKVLCYSFVYHKSLNYFLCLECRKMKKYCYIKRQKDADGKEYFNHDSKKHICKPIRVSTISASIILKEHGLNFEAKKL